MRDVTAASLTHMALWTLARIRPGIFMCTLENCFSLIDDSAVSYRDRKIAAIYKLGMARIAV